jgi:hypothetical protein
MTIKTARNINRPMEARHEQRTHIARPQPPGFPTGAVGPVPPWGPALFAAVLPVREPVPRYRIESDDDSEWWKLILPWGDAGLARIASLKYDDDEALVSAIDTLHALLSCPESIAWLLLAAPKETLDQVGALVAQRLEDLPS